MANDDRTASERYLLKACTDGQDGRAGAACYYLALSRLHPVQKKYPKGARKPSDKEKQADKKKRKEQSITYFDKACKVGYGPACLEHALTLKKG